MNPIVLAVLAIIAISLLPKLLKLLSKTYHLYKHGSKFPGPPALPIIGNAHQIPLALEEWEAFFTKCASEQLRKGKEVMKLWVGPDLKIFPLTGKAVKDILDNTEEITKANDYGIIFPWLGDGLLLSTDDKWRSRRRMLTPLFQLSMLDGYVETMDRESRLLTEILEEKADEGTEVDMFYYTKRCALDIICEVAMGYQLNSQKEKEHSYAKTIDEMGLVIMIYNTRPWLWLSPLWYLSGWASTYNSLLKKLKDFTTTVINNRVEKLKSGEEANEISGRKAFLDMLLEMRKENALSDEDLREEADTFMFTGHDTTATGVSWTLWCLATHPEIQEKVYGELYDIFGDCDRDVTKADMKKLIYLDMVIKEAMRINPPAPFLGRYMKNDFNMGEYTAPKGSQLYISPLIIHRNPEIFPEPLRFDPDRFLPENVKNRHPYDYIPFSAGPRICIGQKFATYEEKIMTAWIIRKFKLTTDRKFEENKRLPEMVLRPEMGVPVRLERRVV